MKLVWTKSKLPLSLLIRGVTGEDCSHFLFVFDNGVAFQSNLLGTNPVFWNVDMRHLTVVHELDLKVPKEVENHVWHKVISKYAGKPYDYGGFFYLGFWFLMKRFFGIKMPAKNKWSKKGTYYCDELYDCLSGVPGLPNLDVAGGMDTPHMVWERLNGSQCRLKHSA
jgi:hypothetical protein